VFQGWTSDTNFFLSIKSSKTRYGIKLYILAWSRSSRFFRMAEPEAAWDS
jgi:hypothetical protein